MKREPMSRGGIPPASAVAPAGAADKASTSDAAKSGPRTPAEREQDYRKRQQDEAKASKETAQKTAKPKSRKRTAATRAVLTNYEIGGRISQINDKGRALLHG